MTDSLRVVLLEMIRSVALECVQELRAEFMQQGSEFQRQQVGSTSLRIQDIQSTAGSSTAVTTQTSELNATEQVLLLEKFVTATARKGYTHLVISAQCVVSPMARDRTRELGITIVRRLQ